MLGHHGVQQVSSGISWNRDGNREEFGEGKPSSSSTLATMPHPGNNHQDSAEWQSLGNFEEMSFYHISFIFLLDFTCKD